jgi:hypothetical protein
MLLADGSYMSASMYNKPLLSWIILAPDFYLLGYFFRSPAAFDRSIFQPRCTYTVDEALIRWALKLNPEGFSWHQVGWAKMITTCLFLMGSLEKFSLLGLPGPHDLGVFPSTTTKTNMGVALSELKQKTRGRN